MSASGAGRSPDQTPEVVADLPTPALVVDLAVFDANVATMAAVRPGRELRPHAKAFKSTALARRLVDAGHRSFCTATVAELVGLARAGVGDDLLLANELGDPRAYRALGELVEAGVDLTVAVDSEATVAAAAAGGVRQVLVDVDVGLPRCGCQPDEAAALAEQARRAGLEVRGVMGYEGHLMMVPDPERRRAKVAESMELLVAAAAEVGGDVISAGGTGTYAVNTWATEIQAGSYCLMDTHYAGIEVPFEIAMSVVTRVISVNRRGWYVVDAGLKSFAMDHGNPTVVGGELMFCSDEHASITTPEGQAPKVGDLIQMLPAHVDPTVAKHDQYWVIGGSTDDELGQRPVVDRWPVDLRNW